MVKEMEARERHLQVEEIQGLVATHKLAKGQSGLTFRLLTSRTSCVKPHRWYNLTLLQNKRTKIKIQRALGATVICLSEASL